MKLLHCWKPFSECCNVLGGVCFSAGPQVVSRNLSVARHALRDPLSG